MYDEEVTTRDLLIGMLFSCRNTGIMRSIIYERVKKRRKETLQKTLVRMLKEGIVVNENDLLKLTDKGKVLAETRKLFFIDKSHFAKNAKQDLIISFDIPEYKRKTRDWLRKQIIEFGYSLIQRSVWIGPSPLPKTFLEKLTEMDIKKSIKFMKLSSKK